ncbi:MAG: HAD family hydrolase [Flavisolibacter sp.]
MKNYQGYLFDLNGTMIDDMHYHVKAWHDILNELGANISMEQMKRECYGKNHELLERTFPGRFTYSEKDRMSLDKEKRYQEDFRPNLKLVDGLHDFLVNAHNSGKKTAIGSAAIMFNIDFVLDSLHIRKYIDVIVSADEVEKSKPDPETFLTCAKALSLLPADCIVYEDSPKGVESAKLAGMDAIVITTMHQPDEFDNYENVIGFISNFNDPLLNKLL